MGIINNLLGSMTDLLHKRLSIQEDMSEKFIKHFGRHDSHIESIEREIESLNRKIDGLSKTNSIVAEGISNTNAIIQALKMSGKSLHYKEIFDIIKNYDLKRSHVTLDTIRGASYQLVKRKKIKNGKKPGTFYFKEQKDS
jgi:hypothetical protein